MAGLERREHNGVVWWSSPSLAALGVRHGFSTRHGGVSAAPFDSLNLGRAGGVSSELSDSPENRAENLRRFAHAIDLGDRSIARVHQVHGAEVVDVCEGSTRAINGAAGDLKADALVAAPISMKSRVAAPMDAQGARAPSLMITIADCAPILLACPRSGVIAAVHAGWRGVVAGVIARALAHMAARGADIAATRAAIGPCIGVGAFEVGDEVVDAFTQCGLEHAVRRRAGQRATIDLTAAVNGQLRSAGVSASHIDCSDRCTYADHQEFFSYRRDGARSGRMAALILGAG